MCCNTLCTYFMTTMANLGFPMDGRQPPYFVNLVGSPLPLPPPPHLRSTNSYTSISTHLLNCYSRIPVDSILLAVLTVVSKQTVSGHRQPDYSCGWEEQTPFSNPQKISKLVTKLEYQKKN